MTSTKRCPRCGETKPVDEFHRDRSRPDGLARWCKVCKNEHGQRHFVENKDRIALRRRDRRVAAPVRGVAFPRLHDAEWLRQQYCDEIRTVREIAEEIGCAECSVNAALRRAQIPRLPPTFRAVLRARRDREMQEASA